MVEVAGKPKNAGAVDAGAVRAKYRQERDKRIRADGLAQYVQMTGSFERYLDDPWAARIEREPVSDEVEVALIGGGFAGLIVGARLREAGVRDIRIIDKAADFGGTWYWNRYPGAACDTESYIYMPFLEETGYIPKEKYAKAPEIFAHCRRIATHYDLYRNALLQTRVTELRWDDDAQMWIISTDRNDRFRSKFVCVAIGPLSYPKLPGIPGIETFKGHSFHASRWDYAYTGGNSYGNLTRLLDKSVAIIGTGATAIQCVPQVGASAGRLFVFQRTPSTIGVRDNRPTDPAWARSLEPGWQKLRMENFSTIQDGGTVEENLVDDGFTELSWRALQWRRAHGSEVGSEAMASALEQIDLERMEELRGRVEAVVKDPRTAEALKPYYRYFCKRPGFSDEYLQTFNRPNVVLVDTNGRGVERITEHEVVANGTAYAVDCIIFASGFEWGTALERRAGFPIFGRGGGSLSDRWRDGIRTYFGMHAHGFPNCFILNKEQVGLRANMPHTFHIQSQHVSYVVQYAQQNGVMVLDASEQAEEEWVQHVLDSSHITREYLESCTPSRDNNEGHPNDRLSRQNGYYDPGVMAYAALLEDWRRDGTLAGLDIRR
ncbi:MAG: NAD(P)/FAD-dependent oxidoreductase [Dehalococcoidia bacterium]